MKKMLALLLTLCLLAGLVPLSAGAEGTLPSASDGTITLTGAISGDQTISENNVTLDGSNLSFTNGKLMVTADNVTIKNLTFGDGTSLIVTTTGKFTLTDCKFEPSTVYSNSSGVSSGVRTAAYIKAKDAVITNNIFGGIDNGYYNAIEFGINNDTDLASATISNNQFTKTIQNNYFNFYNLAENAVIEIDDNQMLLANKASNGIRISNNKNVSATFNVDGNTYSYSSSSTESEYEGLILLQDYAKGDEKQDFTKIKINITNLTSPSDAKQLFYVYDDQGGIINTNQPALSGDSSLEKFSVASIDSTYYPSVQGAISAATEKATVKLLKGTTENVTISKDKTLTLDLNGKTLSGSMKVIGNLTIQDSATGGTISNTGKIPVDGGRLTLKSGTISVEDDYGVYVLNGGSATINGGTISSKYSALAGNNTTGDMNFEVTGGTLTAKEGPAIYMPGQITMNISGGTLNGGISLRMGQITISGGTINATNGTIDAPQDFYNYSGNAAFPDALYVLNGTYTSQNETYKNSLNLTITGGTFNCANRQGSAVAIYDLGKVAQESKVTISGDAKFSTNAVGRSAYQVLTLSDIGVVSPEGGYNNSDNVGKVSTSISGGYFTSDPSEYCPEGLTGLPGQYVVDGNTYQYMVDKKLDEAVKVATGETVAKPATGVDMGEDDVKKIGETKADGLTPEANDTAADLTAADKADKDAYNEAVEKLGVKNIPTANSENITTVIAPRLEIEITGYDKGIAEAPEKSLTLNIEAVYDIKATTATGDTDMVEYDADISDASKVNTVTIKKNAGTLDTTGQDVVISIPLPANFVTTDTEPIFVQHKGYEYTAKVTKTSEGGSGTTYTATFTNPHGFSTFVLSTETKTVATVNGTNYTNFQQAVNATVPNGIIEVKEDGQIANDVTHSLTLKNDGTDSITVTINGEKIKIPAGGTKPFTYTAPTPPRPTEEKHSITISTDGKGQVTGPASAAEDDTVTLTVKPNADKELYDLKVTDEDGKAVAVTKVNDTTYTFTMPDGKVTIAATFGCDGGDNCPSKAFTDLGDKQWYHDSIDYAVENGLLEGTSPTTMEPNATLIRAQLAQILYNIEDKPAVTGEMIFEDVPASEWFYSPVLWANQNDIINGTSPTTFEPLEDISRQDLALMLYRYAGKPAVTGDLDGFTDGDQVGDWAEEAMAWAVAEGIVQGDTPTTLNPTGTATRAEAAAMLQRFLEDAA